MSSKTRFKSLVQRLRNFRKWHRTLGLILSFFLLISATTGILLALKKEVKVIQPKTQKGVSIDMNTWKSMATLSEIATTTFHQKYPEQKDNSIDRIDVRPSKGMVKVLFEKSQW